MRALFALSFLLLVTACQSTEWRSDLRQSLLRLGHRNVIAVVDAAYPAQTAPGITTRYVGGDQVDAVRTVLQAVQAAGHVQPTVLLDRELAAVAETAAPGIGDYRQRLTRALAGAPAKQVPHEELIKRLDETARQFEVLVLKTDLRLPYGSVFLWLDCGYWDGEREAALRQGLAK